MLGGGGWGVLIFINKGQRWGDGWEPAGGLWGGGGVPHGLKSSDKLRHKQRVLF